ncbi:hypothetical protein NDA15_005476 [Ustilago hordei]|nr:hypothetical protein NDA15_005476 [Ustilago hordei]
MAMDLSSYQQSMDPNHKEEEHDDGDNEGNSQILSLVSIVEVVPKRSLRVPHGWKGALLPPGADQRGTT